MLLFKFIKEKRNAVNLTQPELAEKAGMGIRFIRELEQGKEILRIDIKHQNETSSNYKEMYKPFIIDCFKRLSH